MPSIPGDLSYDQNQENGCLENYKCVRAFKHQPVLIDQVFCTRCMLYLLQSWRFQLTVLPGIGVGASKFLGMKRIFAQNFPNLPKKLSCNFGRPFLWCDLQKMVFTSFSANLGCHFSKSNNVGHHFCPNFQGFCSDFQVFCLNFKGFCPGCKANKNVWECACTVASYTTVSRANHAKSAKHIVDSHVFFETRTHWQ